MRQPSVIVLAMLVGLATLQGLAQERSNLVTSHQTSMAASGYTQIDFTLSEIPDQAMLSFGVRFEPRFV
ncbi:hypothetical protein [Candidatus Entotheonella palauensis]|uniref:Uncharacterized protein n=1 Tax=Candidatus Entotheonella gemina TaxID=1429439 RepID=W4LVE6_9BACT|nr:hypothetical protein [Candidatus Entotheonella palauensis]ETX01863.1 MAG: hypothetical protein ETSY2_36570 [Candidatus Entotheonella gemina]